MMVLEESISKRILLLRSMHSLTPSILARKLKMSPREYRLMEKGRADPDYFAVRRLMEIYGCTADYLLFGIMLGLREELFARLTDGARANMNAAELHQVYKNNEKLKHKTTIRTGL
jgi:transcriptional regulator with XRE-family HTH domain